MQVCNVSHDMNSLAVTLSSGSQPPVRVDFLLVLKTTYIFREVTGNGERSCQIR